MHFRKYSESVTTKKFDMSRLRNQNHTATTNGPPSQHEDNSSIGYNKSSQIDKMEDFHNSSQPITHPKPLKRQSASTRSLDNLEPRRAVGKAHHRNSTHGGAGAVIFEDPEPGKKGKLKARHVFKAESKTALQKHPKLAPLE